MSKTIYIKNISTGTLHMRSNMKAVEKLVGGKEVSILKNCISRNTVPFKNKFLFGYNKEEVENRLPEFHIRNCTYRILLNGYKRSYHTVTVAGACKYLNIRTPAFAAITTEFLEAYGYAISATQDWYLLGATLSILPPVQVKGKFIVIPRTVQKQSPNITKTDTTAKPPPLTHAGLDALWRDWNQNGHNAQRFGQYVMNQSNFKLPQEYEDKNRIDLFFETDAKKCYDVISHYLESVHQV